MIVSNEQPSIKALEQLAANRILEQQVIERLHDYHLSLTEVFCLECFQKHLRGNEIADEQRLTRGAISTATTHLLAQRFIAPNGPLRQTDRRFKEYHLTPSGQRILAEALVCINSIVDASHED
ncbi:hypothetical protein ACRYI5_05700 [Furfurilactobacillus sp. WILCCON 0119]